MRCGLWRW